MTDTSLMIQSPVLRTSIVPKEHSGGPALPLLLRRVETFELDDQDCAEETYEHWSSLPGFLEAKMYLCPITEIITVTAFFAQTLPPGTLLWLRCGYFERGSYPFFADESIVLAMKTQKKQKKGSRKKAKVSRQCAAIKDFAGRLEVIA